MNNARTLLRICYSDTINCVFSILFVLTIIQIIAILFHIVDLNIERNTILLFIVVSLILFFRVKYFFYLYENGGETKGKVLAIFRGIKGSIVKYTFIVKKNNRTYTKYDSFGLSSYPKRNLQKGKEVTILYDLKNPQKSIIKEVFFRFK